MACPYVNGLYRPNHVFESPAWWHRGPTVCTDGRTACLGDSALAEAPRFAQALDGLSHWRYASATQKDQEGGRQEPLAPFAKRTHYIVRLCELAEWPAFMTTRHIDQLLSSKGLLGWHWRPASVRRRRESPPRCPTSARVGIRAAQCHSDPEVQRREDRHRRLEGRIRNEPTTLCACANL